MRILEEHIVLETLPISFALEKLSSLGKDLTLFVVEENKKLIGTLTDGDIRRGLIKGIKVNEPVSFFMNTDFKFLTENEFSVKQINDYKMRGIFLLPILNSNKQIIKIINLSEQENILPITAIIMAGGEGQRLRPLTEETPKSLLKVGDKPIIEHVVDRIIHFGINNINISVNYLGEQIIDYFKNGESKDVNISYVKENEKLGTAGSVSLIKHIHHDAVLLMNADILTNINFEDLYNQFIDTGADLIVACIPYYVNVPYAVLEVDGLNVKSLKEKPKYTYYSNAGIYLIKKEHLNLIPLNKQYDATDLIEDLIAANKKVINFPIHSFWLDIGNHDDYNKANEYLKFNKL